MNLRTIFGGFSEPCSHLALCLLGLVFVAVVATVAWKSFDKGQEETCNGKYRTTACLVKLTAKTKAKEDYDKLIEAIDKQESNKTGP